MPIWILFQVLALLGHKYFFFQLIMECVLHVKNKTKIIQIGRDNCFNTSLSFFPPLLMPKRMQKNLSKSGDI